MDFLLSLSPEGKKKIAHLQSTNKGVIADYQLSEDDVSEVYNPIIVKSILMSAEIYRLNGFPR